MFDKINVANRQYERRMQFAESVYVYYGEDG